MTFLLIWFEIQPENLICMVSREVSRSYVKKFDRDRSGPGYLCWRNIETDYWLTTYTDDWLLGCCTMLSGGSLQTFQRFLLFSSWGATTQKFAIFVLAAVRTWNLASNNISPSLQAHEVKKVRHRFHKTTDCYKELISQSWNKKTAERMVGT
jgi:hypothetical protein